MESEPILKKEPCILAVIKIGKCRCFVDARDDFRILALFPQQDALHMAHYAHHARHNAEPAHRLHRADAEAVPRVEPRAEYLGMAFLRCPGKPSQAGGECP
jgi:hypothetical protein